MQYVTYFIILLDCTRHIGLAQQRITFVAYWHSSFRAGKLHSCTDRVHKPFALQLLNIYATVIEVGQDSSVGIATHYRLDDPGIKSQGGQHFLHPSRLALGPTQPPI